jgi:hypothetical protein
MKKSIMNLMAVGVLFFGMTAGSLVFAYDDTRSNPTEPLKSDR